MLASEKIEELKTRKNCVPAGYGPFDRRVVPHRLPGGVQPYAAVVPGSESRHLATVAVAGNGIYRVGAQIENTRIDHL